MIKFSNLQDYLINKTGRKVTQAEIAQALNLDKSSISLRIKRDSLLNKSHIERIEDYFGISLDDDLPIENNLSVFIDAKLYPDVFGSCGNGVFEQSQNFEKVKLPAYMLNNRYNKKKEYSIIKAKGNSMTGSIEDGDKLLIESVLPSEQIIDNEIYIFCYNNELFIKRLIKNIDQIIIKSDNKDIPIRYIEGESINNFSIQGRVIGLVRSYLKESDL